MADGYDAPPPYEEVVSLESDVPGLPTYHEAWMDGFDRLATLKNGVDIVTKAIEEDRNKNYEEALKLYNKSVEYFEYGIENEAESAKSKEAILKKLQTFKRRAENIRTFLADRDIRRKEESILNIAVNTVTKAVEEDKSGNYEEALLLYETSIEYFEQAKDESQSEKATNLISTKLQSYKERAEIIDKYLQDELIQQEEDIVATNSTEEIHHSASRRDECKLNHRISPEELLELSAKTPQGVTLCANLHTSESNWKDVPGLLAAKTCLTEAVLIPAKFPHLFRGKRKLCRCVLLYGPHGTGKFYLSKATATEANISLLFKVPCRKLVEDRTLTKEYLEQLFSTARSVKPSMIYLDHVDALNRTHAAYGGPNPMITTFNREISRDDKNSGTTVIGSTEQPWLMAPSLINAFKKRIYVPMPDSQRRSGMFQLHLRRLSNETPPVISNTLTRNDMSILGEESAGCSAFDIARVIQDLMRKPDRMHPIVARVTKDGNSPDTTETTDDVTNEIPSGDYATDVDSIETDLERKLTPITLDEILDRIKMHQSDVSSEDHKKYEECSDLWGEDSSWI